MQMLQNVARNLPNQVSSVMLEYPAREVSLNKLLVRIWPGTRGTHISPMGVIPKKIKLGKQRLIMDLSSSSDHSISDGIYPKRSSLFYTSVDHLIFIILLEGQEAFVLKAAIKDAYRMVPIHPQY